MNLELLFEIVGAIIGITYLILEYKASFYLWGVGVIMSFFYIVIFFRSQFYADMAIYVYYLGANIYGLFYWLNYQNNKRNNNIDDKSITKKKELPITNISSKYYFPILITMALFFVIIYFILSHYTDSPVPVGDAFTTSLSVVAMWLLAKKKLQHWLIWIVVNFTSSGLYLYKELFPTAILFAVYGVASVFAFFYWKKMMLQQKV